jgi:UPF0755 protein
MMQPMNAADQTRSNFVIPKGQAISVIGQRLTDSGFLRNPLVFRIWVQLLNVSPKIQAGTFVLSKSQTPKELVLALTKGTDDVWVTILEGWRVEEIADMLARQTDLVAFDKKVFLEQAQEHEGTLFPDTYLIRKTATAEEIITILTNTYAKKLDQALGEAVAAGFNFYPEDNAKITTLASLVQREASTPEQMVIVANILNRRLKMGMALDVDASLQYIAGYNATTDSWWSPPSVAVKQSTSQFNTYKYPGLPPRPICNPGYDALVAARFLGLYQLFIDRARMLECLSDGFLGNFVKGGAFNRRLHLGLF